MQTFKIAELKPHPRNDEFFDDVTGQKWEDFLDSVRKKGIIEHIIVDGNKTIVSGHQRVRACKELGIEEIEAEVHVFDNEDDELRELLYTNIRRRGELGVSLIKLGRIANEIQRLDGQGKGRPKNTTIGRISEDEFSDMTGKSTRDIQRAKQLANLPTEWQEAINGGVVAPRVVNDLVCRLSEEEQAELIKSLPATEKVTKDQMSFYIDQIRRKDNEIQARDNQISGYQIRLKRVSELENAVRQAEEEKTALEGKMKSMKEQLANQPVKEVPPADYDEIKRKLKESYKIDADADRLYRLKIKELEQAKAELEAERQKVRQMEADAENERKRTAEGQYEKRLFDDVLIFTMKCNTFLKDVGGYAYLCERMSEIPEEHKNKYKTAVDAIGAWATNVSSFI